MEANRLTREALFAAVDQVSREPTLPLEVQTYDENDFGYYDQQEIWFLRGSTNDYRDTVHFWLKALQYIFSLLGSKTFDKDSLTDDLTLCKEISLEDFTRIRKWYYAGAKTDDHFALRGQFQQAWLMLDEGYEIAVLARTDCEFVAFWWETTN